MEGGGGSFVEKCVNQVLKGLKMCKSSPERVKNEMVSKISFSKDFLSILLARSSTVVARSSTVVARSSTVVARSSTYESL